MPSHSDSAVEIQRRYYTDTAERYDHMHAYEGAGDPSNLKYVSALFQSAGVQSVLEVGCATGRGLRSLQDALPDAYVCGLEPVGALLREATKPGDHTQISWIQGVGESLPFADSNRFGQGSKIGRLVKFALYKTGLWPAYWSFRTRGKGYIVDEGDGLAY